MGNMPPLAAVAQPPSGNFVGLGDSFVWLGDDNVVFSTDYPHPDSAFPHAVDELLSLSEIPNRSKKKIPPYSNFNLSQIAERGGGGRRDPPK